MLRIANNTTNVVADDNDGDIKNKKTKYFEQINRNLLINWMRIWSIKHHQATPFYQSTADKNIIEKHILRNKRKQISRWKKNYI